MSFQVPAGTVVISIIQRVNIDYKTDHDLKGYPGMTMPSPISRGLHEFFSSKCNDLKAYHRYHERLRQQTAFGGASAFHYVNDHDKRAE
jgi:hypothetical protein